MPPLTQAPTWDTFGLCCKCTGTFRFLSWPGTTIGTAMLRLFAFSATHLNIFPKLLLRPYGLQCVKHTIYHLVGSGMVQPFFQSWSQSSDFEYWCGNFQEENELKLIEFLYIWPSPRARLGGLLSMMSSRSFKTAFRFLWRAFSAAPPAGPLSIWQLLEFHNTLSRMKRLSCCVGEMAALWKVSTKSLKFLHKVEKCDKMLVGLLCSAHRGPSHCVHIFWLEDNNEPSWNRRSHWNY